jgi:hypothetical protein
MTRAHTVRKAVLEILEGANPYAMPEKQLHTEIDGAVRPPVGQAEFDETILFLQSRKAIATVPDGLDPENVKWTITEVGKTLLRE